MPTDDTSLRARATSATRAIEREASRLFTWWRALVTRVVKHLERSARDARNAIVRWKEQWPPTWRYLTAAPQSSTVGDAEAAAAAAFGVRCLAGGLLLAIGVAVGSGESALGISLMILTEILWVAARFTIISLLIPPAIADRTSLLALYAAALIPYAIGVSPTLRLAALVASAVLTWRGLSRTGVPPRISARALGWSFGGHAVVLVVGFVSRGALALMVGL